MLAFIIRRMALSVLIVFGVMILTFLLFRVVAIDPARVYAGKQKSEAQLQAIRHQLGLDKPKLQQFEDVMLFRFQPSMRYQESVWTLFKRKAPVSLAIQLPAFIIELGLQLGLALFIAARRGRSIDYFTTFLAVLGLSLPGLSIYLGVQWFFGGWLQWFPVAGWSTGFFYAIHFAALPILATVIGGIGGGVRFYRTVSLEEINSDYVRTARAKGVSESSILLVHLLRNVMIPVVTNTVIALPFLFAGSIVLEKLFQIPGFGALMVDAIHTQDGTIVMAITYVSAVLYCIMLLITDICYAVVDPRVSLR